MLKVSIITPFYEAFDTIDETVQSVLGQTYDNWELIICNDNGLLGEEFLKKRYSDPRIKTINNTQGQGAAAARNAAVLVAQGKYVTFLDSDDIWSKEKLAIQVEFMSNNSIEFSYGSYNIFKDDPNENMGTFIPPESLSFNDLIKNCPIGCLTVMIDVERVRGFQFPNIKKEDYALWLTLMKEGFVAHKYPGNYAYYRLRSNSLSSNKFRELHSQYNVLRKIGELSSIEATYYTLLYSLNGIKKHLFTYKLTQ
ncbi:UDP-Glc:alpha-D-GlcNAc-diphosphoundecaprenol beta-1,3-glucosyltransferase WfgD [Pseudoalteromonas sp. P1-16-1b]|uniref:glycosyltransferase family 2 protein n=1 Tax=Pseudoalteromonas sp. P1-16-1b TaxID=1723757 RepID=UPI0006D67194|nr:glycosyltransferase family 2 protein [Pseudoalteromonas sp. P1-16-1b]KPZ63265.1 UDP-Glc:alpha-D-GlcNAc-diphosphoundecaprenol beta-1,3-glucosyltransferase WfgD [Pseudoalteromonas sp. P1-16-1b]